MLFEMLLTAGSIWVGRSVYGNLVKGSRPPAGIICPRSDDARISRGARPLPEREQAACQRLAMAATGLGLATGAALGAASLTLIALPVLGIGFLPLIRKGWQDLRDEHRINYGLLITVSTAGALAAGHVLVIGVFEVVYFGADVLLAKTRRRARSTLQSMFDDWPVVAWVRYGHSDATKAVALNEIASGDVVVVRAGEPIPVDGTVISGAGGVDQSLVTGESVVAEKTSDDEVFASTLLLTGTLDIRVKQAGAETLAGQIATVLRSMDSFEASVEDECVKFADASVNPTIAVCSLGWVAGGLQGAHGISASNFADSTRLASPLSIYNYVLATADAGIHVKDGRSIEILSNVDTVVFDKTGTLTVGRLSVERVRPAEGLIEQEILALAAAAEERQQHPIAEAIRAAATAWNLQVPAGVSEANIVGNGVTARVQGSRVHVGSQRFIEHHGIPVPSCAVDEAAAALAAGQTVIHVAQDERWVGQITLRASVRSEVADMIAGFRRAGYKVAILSGDHAEPTQRLAEALGVETWRAGVLPQAKTSFIKQLQAQGRTVCFVGDGINDGMALKAANVSVTLRGASLVATDAAQVILDQDSLSKLPILFDLSRRFRSDQNVMRRTMIASSVASAAGTLLLGLSLNVVYLVYLGTIAACGACAFSPRWRFVKAHNNAAPRLRNQQEEHDGAEEHAREFSTES